MRQIEAVAAHTGPVFVVHRKDAAVAGVLGRVTAGPPAIDATAPDGVRHTLWTIDGSTETAALIRAFDAMPTIYIADGHHRAAAGSRVAQARPAADRLLVVSFPDDEVHILDYNRIVRDLKGMTAEQFRARIAESFAVAPGDGSKPDRQGRIEMYLDGRWWRLDAKVPPDPSLPPSRRLDVSLLSDRVLGPVLGIEDLRTDKRIDFVGGARGLGELKRRVDSGEMAAGFALHPTSLAELFAVADAGEIMPPKSTWFEPKLADGMVSLPLP